MSDEFYRCNECGAEDCGFTNIEDMKTDILKSVVKMVKEYKEKDSDNEYTLINSIEELIKEYENLTLEEQNGNEGACGECGNFTTTSMFASTGD